MATQSSDRTQILSTVVQSIEGAAALTHQYLRQGAVNRLITPNLNDATRASRLEALAKLPLEELLERVGKRSKETVKKYRARYKSFSQHPDAQRDLASIWGVAEQTVTTRGSWNTAKAGITFGLLDSLGDEVRPLMRWLECERSGNSSPQDDESALRAAVNIERLAKALRAMPAALPPKFMQPGANRRPNSKSHSLRGADPAWRQAVAAQLDKPTQLVYLMQSVCGCRSAELVKGTGVEVALTGRNQLHFRIAGAKTGVHAGQPLRELTVDAKAGIARELARRLKDGQPIRSVELLDGISADTYRRRVSRASKRAFPERTGAKHLTTYSSRHQFKADLKAAKRSRNEIALAMGHSTVRSATYYGKGGRGTAGGVQLITATATRPIKQRSPYPGKANVPKDQAKATGGEGRKRRLRR